METTILRTLITSLVLFLGFSDCALAAVRKNVQLTQGDPSVTLVGSVSPTDRDRYFLTAQGGQQLRMQLQSSSGNGVFSFYGPGYTEESGTFVSGKSMQYEATLARVDGLTNGTHLIDVSSLGGVTSYRLTLSLGEAPESTSAVAAGNAGVRKQVDAFIDAPTKGGESATVEATAEKAKTGSISGGAASVGLPSDSQLPHISAPSLDASATAAPSRADDGIRQAITKPISGSNESQVTDSKDGSIARLKNSAGSFYAILSAVLGPFAIALGALSCCVGGLWMPKPDRLSASGFIDERVVTWQLVAVMIGGVLGVIGLFLLRLAP